MIRTERWGPPGREVPLLCLSGNAEAEKVTELHKTYQAVSRRLVQICFEAPWPGSKGYPSPLLPGRRRCDYFIGVLYLLCLERLGLAYDQELSLEKHLYRIGGVQPAPVAAAACISQAVTAVCR